MGKFSDYVGTIKQQTDSIRSVLSDISGEDCSNKSVLQCAEVITQYVKPENSQKYVRPSYYPNIDEFVDKLGTLSVNSRTYYPAIILLFENTKNTMTFGTSNTLDVYFTEMSGVVFGDDCDYDVSNITSDMLTIGTNISHTWNKYINENRVCWAIIYHTSKSPTYPREMAFSKYSSPVEVIAHYANLQGFKDAHKLKYVRFTSESKGGLSYNGSECWVEKIVSEMNHTSLNAKFSNLKEYYISGSVGFAGGNLGYLPVFALNNQFTIGTNTLTINSEYIDLNGLREITSGGVDSPTVKMLVLDNEMTTISGHTFFSTSSTSRNLKYVRIPKTMTIWTKTAFPFVPYVELFNDFNISGVDLSGSVLKTQQWLKDLCIWLKDRTGDTANTLIIGTENLNNANAIYLTFNPSDKRDITFDGVTAETEGAISITEFITTQLNWTLS